MTARCLTILTLLYLLAGNLLANRCPESDDSYLRVRPDLEHSQSCVNTSGAIDFMIHYDTSGSFAINNMDTDDSGVPDYI